MPSVGNITDLYFARLLGENRVRSFGFAHSHCLIAIFLINVDIFTLSHETDLSCLERVKEALVKLEEGHSICVDSPTYSDY